MGSVCISASQQVLPNKSKSSVGFSSILSSRSFSSLDSSSCIPSAASLCFFSFLYHLLISKAAYLFLCCLPLSAFHLSFPPSHPTITLNLACLLSCGIILSLVCSSYTWLSNSVITISVTRLQFPFTTVFLPALSLSLMLRSSSASSRLDPVVS